MLSAAMETCLVWQGARKDETGARKGVRTALHSSAPPWCAQTHICRAVGMWSFALITPTPQSCNPSSRHACTPPPQSHRKAQPHTHTLPALPSAASVCTHCHSQLPSSLPQANLLQTTGFPSVHPSIPPLRPATPSRHASQRQAPTQKHARADTEGVAGPSASCRSRTDGLATKKAVTFAPQVSSSMLCLFSEHVHRRNKNPGEAS